MHGNVFAVVEMRCPELGVLERNAGYVDVLRPRNIENARTHQCLVSEIPARLARLRAATPELLPRVRPVPVDNALAGDRESVAAVGVYERRIILASLALYARLAHRIAGRLVRSKNHRALLEMQIYPRLEEQRPGLVSASLEAQRPAARLGDLVDLGLQIASVAFGTRQVEFAARRYVFFHWRIQRIESRVLFAETRQKLRMQLHKLVHDEPRHDRRPVYVVVRAVGLGEEFLRAVRTERTVDTVARRTEVNHGHTARRGDALHRVRIVFERARLLDAGRLVVAQTLDRRDKDGVRARLANLVDVAVEELFVSAAGFRLEVLALLVVVPELDDDHVALPRMRADFREPPLFPKRLRREAASREVRDGNAFPEHHGSALSPAAPRLGLLVRHRRVAAEVDRRRRIVARYHGLRRLRAVRDDREVQAVGIRRLLEWALAVRDRALDAGGEGNGCSFPGLRLDRRGGDAASLELDPVLRRLVASERVGDVVVANIQRRVRLVAVPLRTMPRRARRDAKHGHQSGEHNLHSVNRSHSSRSTQRFLSVRRSRS